MNQIKIANLEIMSTIGVYAYERQQQQALRLNLWLNTDFSQAAAEDDLKHTLDYYQIAHDIGKLAANAKFELLEALARAIAKMLFANYAIDSLKLQIDKASAIENAAYAAVIVRYVRGDFELDNTAYVALGSNIEPWLNIRRALNMLRTEFGELEVSSFYQNPAVAMVADDFINGVCRFATKLSLNKLQQRLSALETELGKTKQPKYKSRCIDLDLLLFNQNIDKNCKLPHPDILKYPFVLAPLAELAGCEIHPQNGQSYAALWQQMAVAKYGFNKVEI